MSSSIIAYDLGTGGIKASLYASDGQRLASVFVGYETSYPQASWHEQRPEDWWSVLIAATRRLLVSPAADAAAIQCLAISGHSLGCVPLDRDGRLLCDATPIWSDRRAEAQTVPFFNKVDPTEWYLTTGNGFPAAHYTVFKVLWYRDHRPDLFRQIHQIVGTKDYLNFRLTGQLRTDFSYASGCGVYDLRKWDYAPALVAASGLPREIWPAISPAASILGELTPAAATALGLPRSVKVACGGVDNSCMALGARNIAEGRTYASLGSSAWIAVTSAQPLLDERVKPYVFTHVVPGLFNSAVAIFSSGSSFKWVCQQMCQDLLEQARRDDLDVYDLMSALAAASPPGARGVIFNPSLAGGSSLDLSPLIRGAFLGLDLGHTRADLIRAAMEGIAFNLRLALDELRKLCRVCDQMVVVGGSSKSALWRQIFADTFDLTIQQTNVGQDAGSLGAAAVAAVAAGLWQDFSPIDAIHRLEAAAAPDPATCRIYQQMLPSFRNAARMLAATARDAGAQAPASIRFAQA
ncbi:MAG: FGGY-family carbohydrate kinase [Verrucomicrobia bacterium]|nr:FGGY-family carbohydrate kinase [Verrucomicrobiota bacterium]